MHVSIIIPTYNEAENITGLIKDINYFLKSGYEIIVVDDDSPDGTSEIVIDLPKRYNAEVLTRKTKKGLSSAVIEGIKHAKYDYIVIMDADHSHPPKMIKKLVRELENGKDLVIASRYTGGGSINNWPLTRRIISKSAKIFARPLTKTKDPLSGYFAFNKKILHGKTLKPKGYKILLEFIVRTKTKNVKEIPYSFTDRKHGKSKLKSKVYLEYLSQLVSLYGFRLGIKK